MYVNLHIISHSSNMVKPPYSLFDMTRVLHDTNAFQQCNAIKLAEKIAVSHRATVKTLVASCIVRDCECD